MYLWVVGVIKRDVKEGPFPAVSVGCWGYEEGREGESIPCCIKGVLEL